MWRHQNKTQAITLSFVKLPKIFKALSTNRNAKERTFSGPHEGLSKEVGKDLNKVLTLYLTGWWLPSVGEGGEAQTCNWERKNSRIACLV